MIAFLQTVISSCFTILQDTNALLWQLRKTVTLRRLSWMFSSRSVSVCVPNCAILRRYERDKLSYRVLDTEVSSCDKQAPRGAHHNATHCTPGLPKTGHVAYREWYPIVQHVDMKWDIILWYGVPCSLWVSCSHLKPHGEQCRITITHVSSLKIRSNIL